jgi:hypothetical protein
MFNNVLSTLGNALSILLDPLKAVLPFPAETHLASALAALLMAYLCVHPVVAFCKRGWNIKRTDILSSLDDEAKQLYLTTFLQSSTGQRRKPENGFIQTMKSGFIEMMTRPPEEIDSSKSLVEEFTRIYNHRYGRYRLIWPLILLCVTVLILSYLVADSALARIAQGCVGASCPTYVTLPDKAIASIVGAYTWVVYALARDATKYIMPPQAIIMAVLRLLVAAPLGYAVASLASDGLGNFLAFAIGAFPLSTIQVVLQRVANKKFDLNVGAAPDGTTINTDQVTRLDGVDLPTADRLADGDITTISQLAYCDPVQLSMRTNLAFDAITDLVNQALAYLYFGDKLEKVRPAGIRGAIEIRSFVSDLEQRDLQAQEAFIVVARILEQDPATLLRAFKEIASDPYTIFLCRTWGRHNDYLGDSSIPIPRPPAGDGAGSTETGSTTH